MTDIHDYQKKLKQALDRVARSTKLPPADKELLLKFSWVLQTQRVSNGRVAKYVNHLSVISETLPQLTRSGRGLGEASKEDIEGLSVWIYSSKYRPNTQHDIITVVKRFYQWLRATPEEYQRWRRKHIYPAEVDDLNSNLKLNQRFLPSDLFTDSEINAMVQSTEWLMVKASLAFDDEVGPRPGEKLNMKVKDIIVEGDNVICRLGHNGGGKTGERLILLIKSVPLLMQWLTSHPFRNDSDAPLWIGFSSTNRYQQWSYRAYRDMLVEIGRKAGIRKKITPYLFRHSAATRDARLGFTEAQLCMKYGWTLGSKMPRVYLHLANTDLYSKIMQVYGGQEAKKAEPQMLKCARCSQDNHRSASFCMKCGFTLDPEQVAQKSVELEDQRLQTRTEISELKDTVTALEQRLLKMAGLRQ